MEQVGHFTNERLQAKDKLEKHLAGRHLPGLPAADLLVALRTRELMARVGGLLVSEEFSSLSSPADVLPLSLACNC